MEITLSLIVRPVLDEVVIRANLDAIVDSAGSFAGISGGRLTKDGYMQFACEFCQDGPIIATMEGEAVRSMTPGAHVATGELVLCPACNVRNPRRLESAEAA
jgi:hypothetical protein